MNTNEDNNKD